MNFLLTFFTVLLFSIQTQAQLIGTIQTGRPGQAIGAGVVGTGVFQLQSGLDFQRQDLSGGGERSSRTLNNILRLGLTDRFEVSSIIDYTKEAIEPGNQSPGGVSNAQVGFRYNLIRPGLDWLPTLGLQTRFRMKTVSSDYERDEIAPVFLLSAVKTIDKDWTVTGNYGVSYNGFDATPTYSYVLSVSRSLTEKWGSVGEIYGDESNGQGNTYFGAGISYLLNDNLQLDAYASTGNNRGTSLVYATFGVSWRRLAFLATSVESTD